MRPAPLYRIHDSTPIYARAPGVDGWDVFSIARKTARSVFITTVDGELQLDRVALERRGDVKRHGRIYCLAHPGLPGLKERKVA